MKNYNLRWCEEVVMSIDIEANNEEEAEQKFMNGEIDLSNAEEDNGSMVDGSLEIEEVKVNEN